MKFFTVGKYVYIVRAMIMFYGRMELGYSMQL